MLVLTKYAYVVHYKGVGLGNAWVCPFPGAVPDPAQSREGHGWRQLELERAPYRYWQDDVDFSEAEQEGQELGQLG